MEIAVFRVMGIAFLIIIIVIALGLVIYYSVYKRHINKALHEENKPARRMPSMSNTALVIVLAVWLACMISLFGQVSNLYDNIDSLSSQVGNLRNELWSAYDEMNAKIQQANSIITSASYSYGSYDQETHSAEIAITVIPKTVAADAVLTMKIGDDAVSLEETSAGIFSGTVVVDVFRFYDDYGILTIESDGVKQTTEVEEIDLNGLWRSYLPDMKVDFYGCEGEYSQNRLTLGGNGVIAYWPAENDSSYQFTDIRMITAVNGAVVGSEDMLEKTVSGEGDTKEIDFELKKSYKMKESDKLVIYIEAKDSAGYTYRYELYSWTEFNNSYFEDDGQIFDQDGNPIR